MAFLSKIPNFLDRFLLSLLATSLITLPVSAEAETSSGETAAAEGENPTENDEIIVTARRTPEKISNTPVSISVFTDDEIRARSAPNIAFVDVAPNVSFDVGTTAIAASSGSAIYIRGVGQDDFLPTTDPGVGVYLDGVYLGRTFGQVIPAIDIEQIEVLRGPQGTLYGRNSIGGAINVRLKRPSETYGGQVEMTFGTDRLFNASVRADAPLGKKLLSAVSVDFRRRNGFARSDASPGIDFGNDRKFFVRGQLRILASPSLTLDLSADYFRQREESEPVVVYAGDFTSAQTLVSLFNAFAPLLGQGPITPDGLGTLSRPFELHQTGPTRDDFDIWGFAAIGEWQAGEVLTVRSTTALRGFRGRIDNDQDGVPNVAAEWFERARQRQFSQELQLNGRFGPTQLVAGLYFFDEEGRDDTSVPIASGLFGALEALPGAIIPLAPAPLDPDGFPLFVCPIAPPGFPCAGGSGNPLNIALDQTVRVFGHLKARSIAAYGQVEVNIGPTVALSVGGRLTHERKRFHGFQAKIESSDALGITQYNLAPRTSTADWTRITPHLGMKWRVSPRWMAYLSYDRGFRSGTFNGRANSDLTFSDVAPETLDSFEIGAKGSLLRDRVRLSLAAFHSNYRDVQLRAVIPSANALDIFFINAARARITGLEVEARLARTNGFDAGAALGIADGKLVEVDPFVTNQTGIAVGNRLPKTPRFNGSAFVQYEASVRFGTLSFRLDSNWRNSVWHDAANTRLGEIASTREQGQLIFDTRIGLSSPGDNWEIALFGKNLTDRLRLASMLANAGGLFNAYPLRSREFGISGHVRL